MAYPCSVKDFTPAFPWQKRSFVMAVNGRSSDRPLTLRRGSSFDIHDRKKEMALAREEAERAAGITNSGR